MVPLRKASKALVFTTLLLSALYYPYYNNYYHSSAKALSHPITTQSSKGPIINDPKLKAEVVFRGLNFPTSMAFLGPNDILVLEKNDGTVRRIVNGTIVPSPLLHVNVANEGERGMLGIAVTKSRNINDISREFVFLYYTTESSNLITNPNFLNIDNQSGLPANWHDPYQSCGHLFGCSTNYTNAWRSNSNKISFQISTNATGDHNVHRWSWIYGKEISVKPLEQYQLVTHMKLNKFVIGSHIAVEGYNNKTKQWDEVSQITQCPSGTDGPLPWHEFVCPITIPANTTKIRPILNAGWSSQPGKQAVTLFQSMNLNTNRINIHLSRYELVNNTLENPKPLLDLPLLSPASIHYGGKIVIGPDNNLYIPIGNAGILNAKTQNVAVGNDTTGTGGILRITQDGKPVGKGILGDKYPLNLYYGYGIRNSFGIDFDPVTARLWDTENGPAFGDEINLVEPGFNSGHLKVQGIWKPVKNPGAVEEQAGPMILHPEKDLVDFGGKGKYRPPEFTWLHTVGPTALIFINSTKLGDQYKNDMFVGDYDNGNVYHFKLSQNRTRLALSGPLAYKVAYNNNDLTDVIFGHGFTTITDLKVGPDGYLYVLTSTNPGIIYRMIPCTNAH